MTSVFCTKKYSVHVCLKLWPSFSQLHIFKIAVLLSIPQQLWEQNTQMDKNVYTSLFACFKIFVSTENLEVRLYWGLCGSFVSATKKKKSQMSTYLLQLCISNFWLLLKSFLRKSEFLDTIGEISSLVDETKLKFGRIEDIFLFFSVPETSFHNIHKMYPLKEICFCQL